MSSASNKFFAIANPLLLVLALFNIALTLYCCMHFYAYLPTADTWIYVDFLTEAASGNLDLATLLEKHNGVHVIALPKLVYFLDVWLTRGSGALATAIALLAQAASAVLVWQLISGVSSLEADEKRFLGWTCVILLLSAAQAESLMNPANLQWALLVFGAVFTAWCLARHLDNKSLATTAGLATGVGLVGLTSASPLLALIPLLLIFVSLKQSARFSLSNWLACGAVAGVGWLLARVLAADLPEDQRYGMMVAAVLSALKIFADFSFPPIERLQIPAASVLAGSVTAFLVFRVARAYDVHPDRNPAVALRAILFLLLFALTVIAGVVATRFYSPYAFTFRFVNAGIMLLAALGILIYALRGHDIFLKKTSVVYILLTALSITVVSFTEAAAFGYGRNHMRLNQAAYALDIEHPPAVSAMPGTVWEQQDYDFVQANKYKLRQAGIGIYSDSQYRHVGQKISAVIQGQLASCEHSDLKMRQLVPGRGFYKLSAKSQNASNEAQSHAYFVDSRGVIRGFAIPIVPTRKILDVFRQGDNWAGFANVQDMPGSEMEIYAYGQQGWCAPWKVVLPEYREPRKKSAAVDN